MWLQGIKDQVKLGLLNLKQLLLLDEHRSFFALRLDERAETKREASYKLGHRDGLTVDVEFGTGLTQCNGWLGNSLT